VNYKCPECGNPLLKVFPSAFSPLNQEQFDSIKAGDFVCKSGCKGTRGNNGLRYYWKYELQMEDYSI